MDELWRLLLDHPLQWYHSEHDGISNHRHLDGVLDCLFRRRSKKTSKLCVTGLCEGNSAVTGEFPSQRASDAENVSIWWHHHALAVLKAVEPMMTHQRKYMIYRDHFVYVPSQWATMLHCNTNHPANEPRCYIVTPMMLHCNTNQWSPTGWAATTLQCNTSGLSPGWEHTQNDPWM